MIASCRKTQTPRTAYGTRPFIGTISPRLCVVWSPRQLRCQSDPVRNKSRETTVVAAAVSSHPPCRKCGASQPLPSWCESTASRLSTSGVAIMTALLSSTTAVAEKPATPLTTGATRPRGNSIPLVSFTSPAVRPGPPHQQDRSFPLFANSSPDNVFQVSESHL